MSNIAKMIAIAKKFGGGSAPTEVVILPETELEPGAEYDSDGFVLTTPLANNFTVGKKYTFKWNGEEYTTKAADASAMTGDETFIFGNLDIVSGELSEMLGGTPDANAPFVCIYAPNGSQGVYLTFVASDKPASVTLSIVQTEGAASGGGADTAAIEARLEMILPTVLEETTITSAGVQTALPETFADKLNIGNVYCVTVNGKDYACPDVYAKYNGAYQHFLGNTEPLSISGGNAEAPFLLMVNDTSAIMLFGSSSGDTIKLSVYDTNRAAQGGRIYIDCDGYSSATVPDGATAAKKLDIGAVYDKCYAALKNRGEVTLKFGPIAESGNRTMVLPAVSAHETDGITFSAVIGKKLHEVVLPPSSTQAVYAVYDLT